MSQKPLILIAAAAATNNGIGVENGLPWRLRKELAYFTKATKTVVTAKQPHDDDNVPLMNACIMGRNTWEGIPPKYRPFDQRYNIVISSNPHLHGATNPLFTVTRPSIDAALEHIDELNRSNKVRIDRVFVVGGGRLYAAALHRDAHVQVLLTKVQFDRAHTCDAFFPPLDEHVFVPQTHERLEEVVGFEVPRGVQTENNIDYEFFLFENTRNLIKQ